MAEIARNKTLLLVSVAIGSFGAVGQALWLRHQLVDTYPFKVMDPLSYLFGQIGEVGVVISPVVAIAVVIVFLSVKKCWILVLPVVVCPLVFWLVFDYLVWQSSFSRVDLTQPLFEHNTGESVRLLFVRTALTLSAIGFVIGLAADKLISLAEGLILTVTKRKGFR